MKQFVLKPLKTTPQTLGVDFDEGLNAPQREAVCHKEGPLLVIAGAGTGKTKTVVYRVARLIDSGVVPESILLLTFTRKASQEMLTRASHLLDDRCHMVSGGTFHAFANKILRRFSSHIGFPEQFTILDQSDSGNLIQQIRQEKGFHKIEKRFPKKNTILSLISKSVNTEKKIETILEAEYPQYLDYALEIKQVQVAYQTYKQEYHVMDYDDLLTHLYQLLTKHQDVLTQLSDYFRYIMVDEYQDTNRIQGDIVSALAGVRQNVMAVGDDCQSIYAFRGAHFKNIMSFPKRFPNARVVTLEENYRSVQPILNLTNGVISKAREKYTKTLFTHQKGGEKPGYIETVSENEQSRFVCQKILELREEGVPLEDIAVLFRSGFHSNDLEVELKIHNLPFVKYGGFKFMETAHIKDVLAFLRVMANPADKISWQRILGLLEGIGPKGTKTITTLITTHLHQPDTILKSLGNKKYAGALNALLNLIFQLPEDKKPADLLEKAIHFYDPYFKQQYDNYTKRQPDLASLELIAERYDNMETFLTEMSLEPPDLSQSGSEPEDTEEEKLVLSTIHSAKGLEWHTVFILSAVDGYLPSFRSMGDLAQLEEERRLLYVALTRAKQGLYIMKPQLEMGYGYQGYSDFQFSKVTRFLEEGDLLTQFTEPWSIRDEAGPDSRKYML